MHATPAHGDHCLDSPAERIPTEVETLSCREAPIEVTSYRQGKTYLPPEIQIHIMGHYAEQPVDNSCGFCHLFALFAVCQVSRLWYHYGSRLLYSTIPLDISSVCERHFSISSKHIQMEKRIPLLVRTLESNAALASTVRRIQFPSGRISGNFDQMSGALAYWVTCALEKLWLPALIRCCDKLEAVDGLEDILYQLFNGEHFCHTDSVGNERHGHGYLAQALLERPTLREWKWGRGSVRKLPDRVAGDNFKTFADCHRNWTTLQHLAIDNLKLHGLTPNCIIGALEKLPQLRRLTLRFGSGVQKANQGEEFLASLLPFIPEQLLSLSLLDIITVSCLETILDWVDKLIGAKPVRGLFHVKADSRISGTSECVGMKVSFLVNHTTLHAFWEVFAQRNNHFHSRVEIDHVDRSSIRIHFF